MSSVVITTRRVQSGARHVGRFRLGGRAYPLVHAGSSAPCGRLSCGATWSPGNSQQDATPPSCSGQ